MKKLIALIACISVFACMSVSVLAATPTGSIEDISYTEATESASGYFTIDASDVATGNTQTTIVVIDGVGTADENGVKNYNISTSTIQYINQQDTASFTVIPKDHDTYLEGTTEKTLTVLIGGDNISRTELGTITYAPAAGGEDAETITISGTVSGYLGTTLPTVVVTDGTTNYPAIVSEDGTFTVEVSVLSGGVYTLCATKPAHLDYSLKNISTTTNDVLAIVKSGDVNNDEVVDIKDINVIITNYKATSESQNYSKNLDTNEDSTLDIKDINVIITNYKSVSVDE